MKSAWIGVAIGLPLALATTAWAQKPARNSSTTTTLQLIEVTAQGTALTSAGVEADREEVQLTPGGVTIVEGDSLDERSVTSLADTLRYVPGLYVVSDSGGSGVFYSSRGSNLDATDWDMNGIMLLQNGIPVTTADGSSHNRLLNPLSARYAIVARGANGMKYGASTLGGAINFMSPTAYDLPGLVARLSMGSNGHMLGRVTASKVFDNGVDALLTIERLQRDGYRDHTEEQRNGIYGNVGWRLSQSVATRFFASYIDSDMELGGGLTRDQFDADPYQAGTKASKGDYQKNVEAWRVANKSTWQINTNRRLDFGVAFTHQELFHPIVASGPFYGGLVIKDEYEGISTMVRYEHRIGHHGLLFGANYRTGSTVGTDYFNNGGSAGNVQSANNKEAKTFQAYVMDRWHIGEDWVLVPGLQYVEATRTLHVAGIKGHYSTLNPRLGVIYHLRPGVDLFANISRTYEPPTNFELDDPTTKVSDTLAAMEGTVVEIGTRGTRAIGNASRWHWGVTVYYGWLDNEILTVKNPHATGPRNRFVTSNAKDTIHAGIEAQANAHLRLDNRGVHAIEPKLSFTLNHFRFDDSSQMSDNQLPAAPEYVLKGEILYRNASGFYIGPTFDVVGERFADYANTYIIDSYTLLGMLAGWSNDRLNVYLEVENVLDEQYVSTHSVKTNAGKSSAILRSGAPLSLYLGVKVSMF